MEASSPLTASKLVSNANNIQILDYGNDRRQSSPKNILNSSQMSSNAKYKRMTNSKQKSPPTNHLTTSQLDSSLNSKYLKDSSKYEESIVRANERSHRLVV